MKKQYYWLSMARPTAGGNEFAGVVILPLKAVDINDAIHQAQGMGHVAPGLVCKGGPLIASVVPPQQFVGRVLDEAEAREAMAVLESAAQG